MKHLKMLGLAALSAAALMSIAGAGTASATTFEVGEITQNEALTLTMSMKTGTSWVIRDTFGFAVNTCTGSHLKGKTTTFTTIKTQFGNDHPIGLIEELTFSNCDHTVTVHNPGKFYIEWTTGTNGRVFSEEAEITTYSTIHGTHINCTTGAGTPIGTITGVASGQATLDLNATVTCGPHLHSARWTGSYTVTSPNGLGVSP